MRLGTGDDQAVAGADSSRHSVFGLGATDSTSPEFFISWEEVSIAPWNLGQGFEGRSVTADEEERKREREETIRS